MSIEPALSHDPLAFDLGYYRRVVTATNSDARRLFNQGLLWTYGFNFAEALTCFRAAVAKDPGFAMGHWGIAFTSGPFYNWPWPYLSDAEIPATIALCYDAIMRALSCSAGSSALECDLIEALARRFPQRDPLHDRAGYAAWDDAFADAMRGVLARHPEDPDVQALTALALMTRTPWALWDTDTGEMAEGADTAEAIAILEAGLKASDRAGQIHPGLIHIYIHAVEMSPTPELGLERARQLGTIAGDCAHYHHMPAHIYVQCGLYADALEASKRAARADAEFSAAVPKTTFYLMDRCHHLHLLVFAAMQMGRFEDAMTAAEAIRAILSPENLGFENALLKRTMEGYASIPLHVLIRFGRWSEIVERPLPADAILFPVSTAFGHYARAIAFATLGDKGAANAERAQFRARLVAVPTERRLFNNPAISVLRVAEEMMDGEVSYHSGLHDLAFERLRVAVGLSEALVYNEPWAWMHPARHALGALLLEQGHVEEALDVYRQDLGLDPSVKRCMQNRGNVWALHGYHECLLKLGRMSEASEAEPSLKAALSASSVVVKSSCFCRGAGGGAS